LIINLASKSIRIEGFLFKIVKIAHFNINFLYFAENYFADAQLKHFLYFIVTESDYFEIVRICRAIFTLKRQESHHQTTEHGLVGPWDRIPFATIFADIP